MTKAELHRLVDALPDESLPAAPIRSPVAAAMMKSDASWASMRRHSRSVSIEKTDQLPSASSL